MHRFLICCFILLLFIGCSNDNQITLVNKAQGDIVFNFRASATTVASGSDIVIKNIPNGTYSYSTMFSLPWGTKSYKSSDNAEGGNLTFLRDQTKYVLIYSSTFIDSTYTLFCSMSSTLSSRNSITGP